MQFMSSAKIPRAKGSFSFTLRFGSSSISHTADMANKAYGRPFMHLRYAILSHAIAGNSISYYQRDRERERERVMRVHLFLWYNSLILISL